MKKEISQRTFVIGDIHGAYLALKECLENVGFDYENDRLIILGDICDGFAQVKEVIEELLKIKHTILICGNHDDWVLEWFAEPHSTNAIPERLWTSQGGNATLQSYNYGSMPESHIYFLQSAVPYFIDENNNLYVHGGIDDKLPMKEQNYNTLIWDRDLLQKAYLTHTKVKKPNHKYGKFNKIFIGHTTTQLYYQKYQDGYSNPKPLFFCNIIALDTGAGWDGKLTIMNTETFEYWQSRNVKELYNGKRTT